MQVTIEKINGVDTLIIKIPTNPPTASASGKTLVIASSRGSVKTDAKVDGKAVIIGLNAYIYPS